MSHTSHTATYFCRIFLDVGVIQHGWKQPDQHEIFCSTAPRPAAIRQSRFWMPGCSLNLQGSPVFRWSEHKILQTKRLGKSQGSHVLELCQLCDVVISLRHYGFNLMHMQNKWRLESCDSAKSASTWTLQSLPKKTKGRIRKGENVKRWRLCNIQSNVNLHMRYGIFCYHSRRRSTTKVYKCCPKPMWQIPQSRWASYTDGRKYHDCTCMSACSLRSWNLSGRVLRVRSHLWPAVRSHSTLVGVEMCLVLSVVQRFENWLHGTPGVDNAQQLRSVSYDFSYRPVQAPN